MEKILTTQTKVRFQDCDPFNHLNNSKYIDYFLNAREDQILEHYNLNVYDEALKNGAGWVVGSTKITYLNPAKNMETVTIDTQLIAFSSKKIKVEMRMWDQDRKVLKSIAWIDFIHFDMKTMKSHTHKSDFMDLFEQAMLPVPHNTFEERSRYLTIQHARTA